MNTKLIEYIITIAEMKSISKAATKLYITQSALNQQLIKLEDDLKIKLFSRTNKEMHLTEAGKIYVDYGKKIVELKEIAYTKINNVNLKIRPIIKIGVTKERGNQMLVDIYPKFHSEFPNITLVPKEMGVKKQIDAILNYELTFGVLTLTDEFKKKLNFIHVVDEELVLAIPLNHPLCINKTMFSEIDLSLFKNEEFIIINEESTLRSLINNIFNEAGITPNIIFETESNKISKSLVEVGIGSTIIPKSYINKNDKCFYFSLANHPKWEIAIGVKKDEVIDETLKLLVDLCKKYWLDTINEKRSSE